MLKKAKSSTSTLIVPLAIFAAIAAIVPLAIFAAIAAAVILLGLIHYSWAGWRPATCMPTGCFCEAVGSRLALRASLPTRIRTWVTSWWD